MSETIIEISKDIINNIQIIDDENINLEIFTDTTEIITSDGQGVKGDKGDQGIPGYTPIKGVDYFDGEKGDQGEPGIQGDPGYTPIKNVDYFDGLKGDKGDPQIASDTVTVETSYGLTSNAGTSANYSRADHTHGTQNYPIAGVSGTIQFNNENSFDGDTNLKWDVVQKSLSIGQDVQLYQNNPLAIQKNIDGYLQATLKNENSGQSASGDFVITADNGSDASHYVDMGINSSTYQNEDYPLYENNDSYLLASDDNLVIGTGADKKVKIHAGGLETTDIVTEFDKDGLNIPANKSIFIDGYDLIEGLNERISTGLIIGGEMSVGTPASTLNIAAGTAYAWNGTRFNKITWNNIVNQPTTISGYNYVSFYQDGTLTIDATERDDVAYANIGHFLKNATTGNLTFFWNTPERIGNYQKYNNSFARNIFGTIIQTGFEVQEQASPNELKLQVNGGTFYANLSKFVYGIKLNFSKLMYCTDKNITLDIPNNNSIIDTTVYNDPTKPYTTAIVSMTSSYWAKALVIVSVDGKISYVYPQAEYSTELLAKAAPIPLASQLRLDGNAFLCDIVYQKGDLSIADKIYDIRPIMERAFGTASSSAGGSAIDHGSLTGLIDDDHDQYYNSSRIDTWLSGKTQDDIADGSTYKRYSDTEKTKLSGIASGANVNVQSNWDETEPTSDSYIQNKPVIPVDAVTEDFVIAMSIALG